MWVGAGEGGGVLHFVSLIVSFFPFFLLLFSSFFFSSLLSHSSQI